MNEKKKSFILYDSDVACVRYLSDKQAGILFKAIAAQRKNSPLPEMGTDPALLILFDQISTHMAMNEEKYKKICEQRTKAAQKRWEQKDNSKNDANASVCNAKRCYNDNDIDNDIENENDNDIDNENDIDIVNDNENDIDIVNDNENGVVNENGASVLNAKKEKQKSKKAFYDMSSVENFFLSAEAMQATHQGTS